MRVPFTVRQFLDVFRDYNQSIWPAQVLAYLIGLICVIALVAKPSWRAAFVLWSLAALWAWNGVAYHWMFFRLVNPAAAIFAFMFVGQAVMLAACASRRQAFVDASRVGKAVGWAMVAYAIAGYAVVGYLIGHAYPESPVFGVAPCPMVIFTFGALTLLGDAAPKRMLVIPVLWALIGTSAAVSLGMKEDFGLPVAAALALWARLSHGQFLRSGRQRPSVAGG